MGAAQHDDDRFANCKRRRERQEDICDHNASLGFVGSIARIVMAAMTGEPGATALALSTKLGLLPVGGTVDRSIFADVVRNVERGLGHA